MPARRLTVVQVLPRLEGGGVERGTVEVSEELIRRGHRSLVVSAGGPMVQEILAHGGEHRELPVAQKSPWTLRAVRPFRKLLAEVQPDILHVRSRVPAWVAWLAWRGLPAKQRPHFVTTAHGLYSVNRYSEIMTWGERVIAISESVEHYLKVSYPRLRPETIRLIPRGVDPDEFPRGFQPSAEWLEDWYQTYPQLLGRPVVSLVGRLTRYKNHPDFLAVVQRLRQRIPDVQALIVGGEDPRRTQYAEEIRQRVADLGLSGAVLFTGHRRDVREIYAVSNVVMALSTHPPEAFGRTTVEALNIGTPVVGYDHGGTGEILRKICPEGAVPVGDVEAAASAAAQILERGVQIPSDHPYLKDRMLAATLAVYDELAA